MSLVDFCICVCNFLEKICGFLFFQISSRKYPKLKEVDDVLGGTAAWENVDSTQGVYIGLHYFVHMV